MSDIRARLDDALGDRYAVGELVGEGGMSFVFSASDGKHDRDVAIKVLKPEVAATLGSERFLREIQIAARCTHPNILPLHDSGSSGDLLYFVMPLVDGPSLRDRLNGGPLELPEAIRISGQVAAALSYAHGQGLVHRDIKPGNVLMVSNQAIVTDFGVARALVEAGDQTRLTGTGAALGTIAYMSPEQADGSAKVDGRTDQYALATMVFEMLTGEDLYRGMTPVQILARKLTRDSLAERGIGASLPLSVRQVLDRATAPQAEDRYASVDDFQKALERAATELEMARVEAATARRGQLRRVGAVAAALVVAAGAWWANGALGGPVYEQVALLALENTGLEEDAFFVEGMHQSLIAEMQEAGIRVFGRSSVMQFADDPTASPTLVADSLSADAVLEGDAYRRADSVGIVVRLQDGASGLQVWSREFTAPARRILSLYGQVTLAVAEQMGVELPKPVVERLTSQEAIDPAAYEAYVRGQFHWNRLTPNDLDLAEQNFREALRIDPGYAQAHAGMAALAAGRQQMGILPPEIAVPQWEAATRAALEADSTNVFAWGTLGGLQAWAYWDWEAAKASHERALELNPSDALNRAYYSHVLMISGERDEGLRQAERALEDDPLNNLVVALACVVFSNTGPIERADSLCGDALEREPTNPVANHGMQGILMRRGDVDGVAELQIMLAEAMGGGELAEAMRGALPDGGEMAMRRGAEFLEAASESTFIQPSNVAYLWASSDAPERALPWLTRAVEARDPSVTYMGVAPFPAVIAESDELADLLERVGIPNQHGLSR